jgi:hypothetical protein
MRHTLAKMIGLMSAMIALTNPWFGSSLSPIFFRFFIVMSIEGDCLYHQL